MRKAQGNTSAMIIMIALLAGIIVYVLVVPPTERAKLLDDTKAVDYSHKVLDINPGKIEPYQLSAQEKEFDLITLTLDNTPSAERKLISQQLTAKSNVISEQRATFQFNLESKAVISSVGLSFNVADKTEGSLTIYVNGQIIISSILLLGENTVEIPIDFVREGSNTVEISVASPSYQFWQTREYVLSDIYLENWKYSSASATGTQTIDIGNYEITDADLSFFAKKLSTSSAPITIILNGAEIYKAIPSGGQTVDIANDAFIEDTNTFNWKVDVNGKYDIEFAKLTLKGSDISGEIGTYKFKVTSSEAGYIEDGNYTCTLKIRTSTPESKAVAVRINGNSKVYEFNDYIEVDVCDTLESGDNLLELSPYETTTFTEIEIELESKE